MSWARCLIRLISLLALALVGLVGATAADAETFCVKKTGCVGTQKATIQAALVAAEQNNITDTVQVGTNGGAPFAEQLSYTNAAEVVHIVGDGVDQTIVEAPPATSVTVTLLSPGSSIEGMSIEVPDVSNGTALRWNATASEIEAVHSGSTATDTIGMKAEGGALLEDSQVSVRGFGLFDSPIRTGRRSSGRRSPAPGAASPPAAAAASRSNGRT
jgi:hypothetical protein